MGPGQSVINKKSTLTVGVAGLLSAVLIAPGSGAGIGSPTVPPPTQPTHRMTAAAADTPSPWLANPMISERDGGAGWGWYGAWTTNSRDHPTRYNAFVRELDSGMTTKLNRRGTHGAIGGFSGDWVVYSQRPFGKPGDVFMAGQDGWPTIKFPAKVNSTANEFLPTMSRDWLMFSRHNAATDVHRVLLYNRRTKAIRELAAASGAASVYAGQVRGDWATWYAQGPEQSNVFRYQVSTRQVVRIPKPPGIVDQHDPAVAADGTVYYQRRERRACGSPAQLMMRPVGGPSTVLWTYPVGKDGGRLVLDPPGAWYGDLNITVVSCALPRSRRTDVYVMDPPSNPFPARHQSMTAVPPEAHAQ